LDEYLQFLARNMHEEINFQHETMVYTLTRKGGVHAAFCPVGSGGKAAGERS
jgi:hypothetical protein